MKLVEIQLTIIMFMLIACIFFLGLDILLTLYLNLV